MNARTQRIPVLGGLLSSMALSLGPAHSTIVQEGTETLNHAQQAIAAQDWEKAHGFAQTALKLDPHSIEAMRLVYQTASRVNPALALETASTLFQHPECGLEEKVKILTYVQLKGDHARFAQLYDCLEADQRKNPDVVFLKARFLANRGAAESARAILEEHLKSGKSEPRFKLLYSSILLQSKKQEDHRSSQQAIAELMAAGGMDARIAFNLLWDAPPGVLAPDLFPPDIDAFVNAWNDARPQEKLIASGIKLARAKDDAAKQAGIFAEALNTHAAANLDLLCSWLTRFPRFDLILQVVDDKKGRESQSLYDHRLRALTAVNGPAAGEAWLAQPHPDSSETVVWMTRAKLAAAKKDGPGALKAWEQAFALAQKESTSDTLSALYRNGIEIGQAEAAVRAVLEAAKNPSPAFPHSAQLEPAFTYLYEKDRLDDLLMLTWAALSRENSNFLLVNNFIYISMVLNREGNDYVAQATKLVQSEPELAGLRSTLAFAHLRKGEHAQALEVLEKAKVDWSKETPACRAIRAVALEKNGKAEEAKAEWKALEGAHLAAAERKSLEALLGRGI